MNSYTLLSLVLLFVVIGLVLAVLVGRFLTFFTARIVCQIATTSLASTHHLMTGVVATPKSIVIVVRNACSAPIAIIGLCVQSACVLVDTCAASQEVPV